MESILKRLQEIRLAKRTRADSRGVAGETADKNSRFLRRESIFFFVRESEMSRKSSFTGWLFLRYDLDFLQSSRTDAPLKCAPRPLDDHAQPECTMAQTGFSCVQSGEEGRKGRYLIAAIKNADRCGEEYHRSTVFINIR